MKVVGRDLPEGSRRRLLQELKGLFGPASRPALEAYGRPFAELIARDEDFRAEVRHRFERGSAYGGFPELASLLADTSREEEDEFFETGWIRLALPPPCPPSNPWDRAPWSGDREAYREDLYSGLAFAFTNVCTFAREWLEELLRVGYYGMEESLGLPVKQHTATFSPAPESLPLYGESYPVRLEGTRQTVWLNLDGPRSEEGQYREVTVSEEPLRTDGAIFAALAMLEGRYIDLSRLREVLPELVPSYGESLWDRWTRLLCEEGKAEILRDLRHHQTLDYVLLLLRYHRPGFDDATLEERASLLAETCTYLNHSLESLKEFMAFVEYGAPGRGALPAAKSVARDVRTAILKDVEGLTYRQIGERLGVPPPADFGYKGDHTTVRKMVGRDRKFLKAGLGDEGYANHVQAMKEEARRRHAMNDAERVLGAFSLLAVLGIRYPLKMLPLLFFEFVWKSIWVLAFGLPLLLSGGLGLETTETLTACLMGVVLVPLVTPWGYVLKHYVKAHGARWGKQVTARASESTDPDDGSLTGVHQVTSKG